MSTPTPFIPPTVGRVVWFYPSLNTGEAGFEQNLDGEPLAAIIARVWSDQLVNLTVFDAAGRAHTRTSVALVQDLGTKDRPAIAFCTWMPFQKGQAAKQEAAAPAPRTHRQDLELSMAHAVANAAAVDANGGGVGRRVRSALDALLGNDAQEHSGIKPVSIALPVRNFISEDDIVRGGVAAGDASQGVKPASRPPHNLDFGDAIRHLKEGRRVARAGWNGKGMWLYLNLGSHDKAEQHALIDGVPRALFSLGHEGTVTRLPNINMRAASGATVTGWLASQTDMLAEDWVVVE